MAKELYDHHPDLHKEILNLNSQVWERDLKLQVLIDSLVAHVRHTKDKEEARTVKLWWMNWIHY